MRIRPLGIPLLLVFAMVLAACGGGSKKADTTARGGGGKSLYERLGGRDAIVGVVDQFVTNITKDEKIAHFFANSDPKVVRERLVEQICEVTGGPCKYTGKDMRTAHTGMKITEDDFNALVGDLVAALDTFQVPQKEKDELLGILGGLKGDIVGM